MRWPQILFAILALLPVASCTRAPKSYPVPAQRSRNLAPGELDPPFADMSASDSNQYLVRNISTTIDGGAWRWTFERPELRFILNCTEGQRFAADFGVVGVTLAKTGPVTISVLINDHPLGKLYCPTPGDRHFEQPVPASWLSTTQYTRVVIQADKLFIAESDGAKLGFTLYRAGFIESCGKPSAF